MKEFLACLFCLVMVAVGITLVTQATNANPITDSVVEPITDSDFTSPGPAQGSASPTATQDGPMVMATVYRGCGPNGCPTYSQPPQAPQQSAGPVYYSYTEKSARTPLKNIKGTVFKGRFGQLVSNGPIRRVLAARRN